MANLKSSKKRARQMEKRRAVNVTRSSSLKTAVKAVISAIEAGEPKEKIATLFHDAQSQISRAQGKGLVHRNNAARKVSRLANKVRIAHAEASR